MKRQIHFLALTACLMLASGCQTKQQSAAGYATIDLTNGDDSYPKKELKLQDFMDVEYIPLETNDEFITQGTVMAIGNRYIVTKNQHNDGDLFLFDRKTGKAIRKINKKGQGAEEYKAINDVVLDEENNELFINDKNHKKIYVYDLSGNFKRSFNHREEASYLEILNYDKNNLIAYDSSSCLKNGEKRDKPFYHAILSKQDGSLTREIIIPFDKVRSPLIKTHGKYGAVTIVAHIPTIIPYGHNWILADTSSDTIYNYIPNEEKLQPFLIKTSSTDSTPFPYVGTITDRYYFIKAMQNKFDVSAWDGYPKLDLVYDTQEKALFHVTVLNDDFADKQTVDMVSHPVNSTELAAFQTLTADRIVEARENGELKGKLKEIAARLDEEDNPVVMLMKEIHK